MFIPSSRTENHLDFVRRADGGTYEAKHQGKNCVFVVEPAQQLAATLDQFTLSPPM